MIKLKIQKDCTAVSLVMSLKRKRLVVQVRIVIVQGVIMTTVPFCFICLILITPGKNHENIIAFLEAENKEERKESNRNSMLRNIL